MRTLEQWSPEEIADEANRLNQIFGAEGGLQEYRQWIAGLRQECFDRRAAAMDSGRALGGWIEQMTARHGPKVKVHGCSYSWLAALGVVRFGEAPEFWPAQFSEEDVIRAKRWLYQGGVPEGVTYITVKGD